jgi:hypothetical protein
MPILPLVLIGGFLVLIVGCVIALVMAERNRRE